MELPVNQRRQGLIVTLSLLILLSAALTAVFRWQDAYWIAPTNNPGEPNEALMQKLTLIRNYRNVSLIIFAVGAVLLLLDDIYAALLSTILSAVVLISILNMDHHFQAPHDLGFFLWVGSFAVMTLFSCVVSYRRFRDPY